MNSTLLSQYKIFNHLDRIHTWLKNETCYPISIQIDPTNKCTRNCFNCSGNRTVPNAQLSFEFMVRIIDQITPFCRGLIFTGGGEPLLNQHALSAIKCAKLKGINVGLLTNADYVDLCSAEEIVLNCSFVRVSYYDDEIWDKIKLLIQAKKSQKSNCTIGISFLTSKQKTQQMQYIVEMAKRIKVDYVQFKPYHLNTFNAISEIEKLKKRFNCTNFQVLASDHKYNSMLSKTKKIKNYPYCMSDNFRAVITADGKLYSDCFTRGNTKFCLGDLSIDSFEHIWESNKRKIIMKSKLDITDCPPMCYHDPLDELLWNIWQQNLNGKHIHFV